MRSSLLLLLLVSDVAITASIVVTKPRGQQKAVVATVDSAVATTEQAPAEADGREAASPEAVVTTLDSVVATTEQDPQEAFKSLMGGMAPEPPETPAAAEAKEPAAPKTPEEIAEAAKEAQVEAAKKFFGAWIVFLIWVFLVLCAAMLYEKFRQTPPIVMEESTEVFKGQDFKYGLCGCFEDSGICCWTFWCGGVQWADSLHKQGFLTFWFALVVYIIIMACNVVGSPSGIACWIVLSLIFTYFRQSMRKAFSMKNDHEDLLKDLCVWCCCMPCAICQDARQLKDISPKMPPVDDEDDGEKAEVRD